MIFVFFFTFSLLLSNTLLVPQIYPSIQNAADNASYNDTILVSPGTYYENIVINEKNLSLISQEGEIATIIDGGMNAPVLSLHNIDNDFIINGFTIQNGSGQIINGASYGGGIFSNNSMLIINNLIIKNNTAFAGGGICFYSTQESNKYPSINNTTIKNNLASDGGGIFSVNHSLTINNTNIIENGMDLFGSGGGIQFLLGYLELDNILISHNETKFGGGIYISNSTANFTNTIIEENYSDSKGGGIWIGGQTDLYLYKNVIARNQSTGFGGGIFVSISEINILNSNIVGNIIDNNVSGAGIYMDGGNAIINNSIIYFNYQQSNSNPENNLDGYSADNYFEYEISYSDIEGQDNNIHSGIGNISENPMFIDIDNNYNLMQNSPCIDSGDPEIIDDDMTISDMGAYPYEHSMFGDVNSDSIINISDIIIIINLILSNEYNSIGDINNDETLNIQDIIIIVNYILNN